MKRLWLLFAICMVLLFPFARATGNTTIFFDDFLGTSPDKWLVYQNLAAASVATNATTSGGYLTVTSGKTFAGDGVYNRIYTSVVSNSSGQMINSLVPESVQFRQVTIKVQPFNLTGANFQQAAPSTPLFAEEWIGLSTIASNGFSGIFTDVANGIYFYLAESNVPLEKVALADGTSFTWPGAKSGIFLSIRHPTGGPASNSFCGQLGVSGSTCLNAPLQYEPQNQVFDLNQQHIFSIQMQYDLGNNTNDYVRWQVDNNGWEGVTQTACSCILNGGSDILPLYPTILIDYGQTGTTAGSTLQTLGTFVDWFLVTDYIPVNLPSGQILSSPANPPTTGQPLGIGNGFSLTQFLQFEANSIAPGNLYAGGMLLTIIVSGTTFAVLAGLSRRFSISVKNYGLFFTMFVLVLSFLFFASSILPIWIPVMMTVITIGVLFGVIKTGNAGGGLVPD